METLFSWQDIEAITPELYEFENCQLIKKIGPYPAGAVIARIAMNFEEGEISLLDADDEEMWTGTLRIRAGDDELRFVTTAGGAEEVNILVLNYPAPTLRAPLDVFQKGRTLKNVMIDYARCDVEVETLDGQFIRYPLYVDVVT